MYFLTEKVLVKFPQTKYDEVTGVEYNGVMIEVPPTLPGNRSRDHGYNRIFVPDVIMVYFMLGGVKQFDEGGAQTLAGLKCNSVEGMIRCNEKLQQ